MVVIIFKKAAVGIALSGLFIYHVLLRIVISGLNQRSVFTLPLNFFLNFLPVFIWLLIFKNAGLIPKSIRPNIHVPLAFHVDTFVFSILKSPLGACLSIAFLLLSAWLLYLKVYRHKQFLGYDLLPENEYGFSSFTSHSCDSSTSSTSGGASSDEFELDDFPLLSFSKKDDMASSEDLAPPDFQDHPKIGNLEFIPNYSPLDVAENAAHINNGLLSHMRSTRSYLPYNCWYLAPPALLAASWFMLNIDQMLASNLSFLKDQISWCSYVLGHFFVPLFTAIWLYVFHCPGALKLFSFALGTQNIAGVMTHLLLPTAPPWFIHRNGENATADYDVLGYAAGLTRAHFSKGTHLVTNGFHKSPIVFGAVPSLHSAMAVLCFLFVCYYSRWTFAKLLLLCFVFLQWWATIYLDHHWRIDLLIGLFYAIVSFTLWYRLRMQRYSEEFVKARLRYDFARGSTMGMRVFRNTKLQNFFDPLS